MAGRTRLIDALEGYADISRQLGAASITFLGTEPLRRAADAARIVYETGTATGVPLHVLSHEEEAFLTVVGVTEGRPVIHDTLVVDIGGGSSEIALVGPDRPARVAGLRIGSARLTSRFVSTDPATQVEVAAMVRAASEVVASSIVGRPREIIAVGGTASNLVKVHADAIRDGILTRVRIAEIQAILRAEPAAAAAERHFLNPIRARLLPAGGAIVEAILDRYDVDQMRVSNASLREGVVHAVLHAGPSWRDRLPDLARGWRT